MFVRRDTVVLLDREIAVITGAASERGIGQAIARLFAAEGARVAILDKDERGAQRLAHELGPGNRGYACDVTSESQTKDVVGAVARDLGSPTILVHAAGITQPKGLEEMTEADYQAVMAVNMTGLFHVTKAVVSMMKSQHRGSIIAISSLSAKQGGGVYGGAHYCAAKAAQLGWIRAIAKTYAPDGLRANAIAPGYIDTDIRGGRLSDEVEDSILRSIPLGRIGRPEDIANACLFLSSSLADWITGEVMDVNGGMYID